MHGYADWEWRELIAILGGELTSARGFLDISVIIQIYTLSGLFNWPGTTLLRTTNYDIRYMSGRGCWTYSSSPPFWAV